MEILLIALVAVALAMDSFAVSITKGRFIRNHKMSLAAYVALWLSLTQGVALVIGYVGSKSFKHKLGDFGVWFSVAFLVVLALGVFITTISKEEIELGVYDSLKIGTMLVMAIATSVDAFAIGTAWAFNPITILHNTREIYNILLNAGIVTAVTFLFSVVGVRIGYGSSEKHEKKIQLVGGVLLAILAVLVSLQNLGVL